MNEQNTDQKLAKIHEEARLLQENIQNLRNKRKNSKAKEIKALIKQSRNKTWEGYLNEQRFKDEIDEINESQDPIKTLATIISDRVDKITADKTLEHAKKQAFQVSKNLKDMKETSSAATAPTTKQKTMQVR
jgi:hypothetical protein